MRRNWKKTVQFMDPCILHILCRPVYNFSRGFRLSINVNKQAVRNTLMYRVALSDRQLLIHSFASIKKRQSRQKIASLNDPKKCAGNLHSRFQVNPKDVMDGESVRKATGVGDMSEILRRGKENDEMEVQLAAEAIETVFNDATTMEDLDKGEMALEISWVLLP